MLSIVIWKLYFQMISFKNENSRRAIAQAFGVIQEEIFRGEKNE